MYLVRGAKFGWLSFVFGLLIAPLAHADIIPENFEGRLLETSTLSSPSQSFPLPAALKPAVAFWQEVFVTYESSDLP